MKPLQLAAAFLVAVMCLDLSGRACAQPRAAGASAAAAAAAVDAVPLDPQPVPAATALPLAADLQVAEDGTDTGGGAGEGLAGASSAPAATPSAEAQALAAVGINLGVAAPPAPAYFRNGTYRSPLLRFFNRTDLPASITLFNFSIYNSFLDQYFGDGSLAVTVFVPTDAAVTKRVNAITATLPITRQQFFDVQHAPLVAEFVKYGVLDAPVPFASWRHNTSYTTLTNLCSNARNLLVLRAPQAAGGNVTLVSASGVRANILGSQGYVVGNRSIVYLVDDWLLPDVVTIPIVSALGGQRPSADAATAVTVPDPPPQCDRCPQASCAAGAGPAPGMGGPAAPALPGASAGALAAPQPNVAASSSTGVSGRRLKH